MVKVRCPKCGTIFPLESAEIQICPTCGCRLRVSRRSAEPAARYSSRQWSDPYKQTPRLPERGGGVYLSREEYENLIYKARLPRHGEEERREYNERDYREYYREKIAPDYTKAEYGTPREVYDYRSFGEDAAQPRVEDAPTPAPEPVSEPVPEPAPEPASEPAPEPSNAPFDRTVADEGGNFGSVPVYDNGITQPEQPYKSYDEAYSEGLVKTGRRIKPFSIAAFFIVFVTLVMNALLIILPMGGEGSLLGGSRGIDLIISGSAVEKIIIIAVIAVPVLFALIGLIAIGRSKKGLKIFAGIFMLLTALTTMYYYVIVMLADGIPFDAVMLKPSLPLCSIWVYIVAGLNLVSAVFLFISAGLTRKKS